VNTETKSKWYTLRESEQETESLNQYSAYSRTVKLTLEEATKDQRGSRGIALLYL